MPFASGSRVTAAALNNATYRTLEARSSGDETVTITETDVNGATLTITTPVANTVVDVTAVFALGTNGNTDIFLGYLYVDGIKQPTGEGQAQYSAGRADNTQVWTVTLASAGLHTLKLRRIKNTNSNTLTLYGVHTKIKVGGLGIS